MKSATALFCKLNVMHGLHLHMKIWWHAQSLPRNDVAKWVDQSILADNIRLKKDCSNIYPP